MVLVFGYVRASTKEEVLQGSTERQKELIQNFCKERGWEVRFYEDKAVSGGTLQRPAFTQMLNDLDTYKPHAIIVAKIDRFARSLIGLLKTLETLQSKGIGFISVLDNGVDTTSPNGKLLLQILGAFAEFERNLIHERTKAGIIKAKEKGVKFGRPQTPVKKEKVIELYNRDLSASAIAKVFNTSISPIRRILKELGLPNKREVKKLAKRGLSNEEIAKILNVKKEVIDDILKVKR